MKNSNSKKDNSNIYMPGEEIKIAGDGMFKEWNDAENTPKVVNMPRIKFGICCFIIAYAIVAIRLLDVCVLSNVNNINSNHKVHSSTIVHRADIVDRNGVIIATSLPIKDLQTSKQKFKPKQTALDLVKIFPELKFDDLYEKLKSKTRHIAIRADLTPKQQAKILAIGNPGLEFVANEKRFYLQKNLTSHVVGFVNVDNKGISGLEYELNERITTSDIPVKLSIDLGVQDTVRTILAKYQKKFAAKGAVAIMMDANTAEIVAMVSLPDFDPNSERGKPNNSNMATSYIYEPGSVLKVFNTAMAIDSGKVKPGEFFDTSPLKTPSRTITEFHNVGRPLNVEEILVHSSNVGSARMALQAGFTEQYNFLKRIKMLEKVKIELPEAARPLVQKEKQWKNDVSAIATIGFGYGLAVSPLHLVASYAAVVNGGLYNNPTILSGKYNPENSVRVMSDNTSRQMRKMLRAVVTKGSGRNADVVGYEVGGKTGTANKREGRGYGKKKVCTSFLSAFPMSAPKYVLIVMMDEPKGLKENYGHNEAGWNVVPATGEIIAATAPQLGVQANDDLEEKRSAKIIEAAFER